MLDWLKQKKQKSPRQPRRRMQGLLLERLEDRALPSAALASGLGSGLDGDDLFSDLVFSSSAPTSKGALYAPDSSQLGGNTGGQAAVPVTGDGGQTPDSAAPLTNQFARAQAAMMSGNVGAIKSPAGPTQTAAPTPQATANVLAKFQGLSNPANTASDPPDSQAAAGPTVVINTVNGAFGMFTKAGAQLATVTDATFWASTPNGGLPLGAASRFTDPVVAYDDNSGRFILSEQGFNNTTMVNSVQDVAISTSSNPTGFSATDWKVFQFRTGEPGLWADFPGKVGFNANTVVFTLNMFNTATPPAFQHAQVNVINKAFLLNSPSNTALVPNAADGNLNQFDAPLFLPNQAGILFTLSPASMHASVSGDPMYFLTNYQQGASIAVIQLTNPLTNKVINAANTTVLPVNAFTVAVGERLNSGSVAPDAGSPDSRMLSAATRNGVLVGAQTVVPAGGTRDAARWYQISISGTPALTQQGNIASVMAGGDAYYPGIDIDPTMDLGVSFIESVGTVGSVGGEFPSMYITGRNSTDPVGTMEAPVLVFAGTADGPGLRGGDMSTMAIDPANGSFWACNEFVQAGSTWNQGIANFSDQLFTQATGVFFTDGNNQLWLFQNGKFTNTGGFAKTFSAGVDRQGNAECWFLDGNNQLFSWDNGVFTNTGGFAKSIAAGFGFVAFSDGNNQLFTFTDGGAGFFNTGGFASRFTAGWSTGGINQIDFADGNNMLWTFNAANNTFTNTGGFTKLFVAGQDADGNNEIWFTDGNNQIWVFGVVISAPEGGRPNQFRQSPGFALSITGAAGGQMYFSDGINQIWNLTDNFVATNTMGFASRISSSPGTTALFFSDGINQLWMFQNGKFTNTTGFASKFSAF
jgi:hypothetical protein